MSEDLTSTSIELMNISVRQIEMKNRARDDYGDIKGLVESIRSKGVIQPIAVVRQDKEEYPFLLLAGGRRFTAAILAKLETVPCRVYSAGLSDLDRMEIEFMENVDRKDFGWQEKIDLTEKIHNLRATQSSSAIGTTRGPQGENAGQTLEATGVLLGKSHTSVSRDLTLAKDVRDHPEAATSKTEAEARMVIKRLKRRKEDAAAAARLDASRSTDNQVENEKKRLAKSYIVGDFFDQVGQIPDRSVSFIECDPPYGIALDKNRKRSNYGVVYSTNVDADDNYEEIDGSEYEEFLRKTFEECYRVLSNGQWMICWYGWQWYDTVLKTMAEAGFSACHIPALWVKPQGQTNSPATRLGSAAEPFIYARKDSATIRQQGRPSVFNFTQVHSSRKIHTTERPVELIQEVIKTFCTESVKILVPFLGSGNTILAAANLGITAFGFDIDSDGDLQTSYQARVARTNPGDYTSYKEEE